MKSMLLICMLALPAIGCGGEQQSSDNKSAGGQTAQTKPYPVDWCIVTGEKLGSMGDPVVRTYQGQEVKFCCKYCIEEFEKTPAVFLARIDSAAVGLIKAPPSSGHGG